MFSLRYLTRLPCVRTNRQCIILAKHFHDESTNDPPKLVTNPRNKFRTTTPAVASKFNVFRDENASVILDVEEERDRITEDIEQTYNPFDNAYSGLNLERKIPSHYRKNRFL